MNRIVASFVALVGLVFVSAQPPWAGSDAATVQVTTHTLGLAEGRSAAKANLEDLAWMVGRWTGEGLGGNVEESWSPASAGSMIGTFKLATKVDGSWQPSFYELMTIFKVDDGVVLRLKHFNPDMTGWEEKDGFVDFPLVKIEGTRAFFRGLTYERTGDKLQIYLAMRTKEGMQEVAFRLVQARSTRRSGLTLGYPGHRAHTYAA